MLPFPRPLAALALAAALITGACADDAVIVEEGATTTASPGGQASPGDGSPSGEGSIPLNDAGAPGTNGQALLDGQMARAQVEIDESEGLSLGDRARQAIDRILRQHGQKQAVDFDGASRLPRRDRWSSSQLRAAAAAARDTASGGGSVTVQLLAVSGQYEDDSVVGLALDASTVVVFPDQLRSGLLGGLSAEEVEEAVVVHEVGHLFGLVNLTGDGAFHEDPEHPGHNPSEESVMHWAVETDAVTRIFEGPPPTTFDQSDQEEMERIRARG